MLNFHEYSSLFFPVFGHLWCLKLCVWLCKLALWHLCVWTDGRGWPPFKDDLRPWVWLGRFFIDVQWHLASPLCLLDLFSILAVVHLLAVLNDCVKYVVRHGASVSEHPVRLLELEKSLPQTCINMWIMFALARTFENCCIKWRNITISWVPRFQFSFSPASTPSWNFLTRKRFFFLSRVPSS